MRRGSRATGWTLLFAVAFGACTWVKVEEQARGVRAVPAAEVRTGCERLGSTTSRTADRVLLFARSEKKIREELEALARNEAAGMGGDTVVPRGEPTAGRQTFDILRCGGS